MSSKELPPIVSYCKSLFAQGIEGYIPSGATDVKGERTNIGGAKSYWQPATNSNKSNITLNNPAFAAAVRNLGFQVFTLNRVQFQDGKPVTLPDGNGFRRVNHGLLLYNPLDWSAKATSDAFDELKAQVPALEGYCGIAQGLLDFAPEVKAVAECEFLSPVTSAMAKMKLHAAIIIAIGSSGPNAGLWSYNSTATKSRADMSKSLTADLGNDIPF